jgi:hypothetical protein
MADQDDNIQQIDDRALRILSTLESVASAGSKSATARRLQEEAAIKQLVKLGVASEDVAKSYIDQIKQETELAKKKEQQQKESEERWKRFFSAVGSATNAATSLVKGSINLTQSTYSSSEAFASVVPTLHLLSDAVKAVSGVLSAATSGIPIVGGIFSGIDKAVSAVTDISVAVSEMRIRMVQTYVDTYSRIAKAGVTYGGDITGLSRRVHAAGLDWQTYSKFLTGNIENLGRMGLGLTESSMRVTEMGKAVIQNRGQLLTMYGGLEEFYGAIAGYASTMTSYGIDTVKNKKLLDDQSISYLGTLKTITNLTGISADQLQRDIQKRNENLAFQIKMREVQEKNPEMALVLQGMISRMGPAGELLQNYIAGEGQVYESTLEKSVQSGLLPFFERIRSGMTSNAKMAGDDFLKLIADAGTAQLDSMTQGQKELLKFQQLAPGPLAEIAKMMAQFEQLRSLFTGVATNAKGEFDKIRQSQTQGSKDYNKALLDMVESKMKQDVQIEKTFGEVAGLVEGLRRIQDILIEKFSNLGSVIPTFVDVLNRLIDLANKKPEEPTPDQTTVAPRVENGTVVGGATGEGDAGAIMQAQREAQEKLAARSARQKELDDDAAADAEYNKKNQLSREQRRRLEQKERIEKAEKEKSDKEKAEKEKADKEKAEKEKADQNKKSSTPEVKPPPAPAAPPAPNGQTKPGEQDKKQAKPATPTTGKQDKNTSLLNIPSGLTMSPSFAAQDASQQYDARWNEILSELSKSNMGALTLLHGRSTKDAAYASGQALDFSIDFLKKRSRIDDLKIDWTEKGGTRGKAPDPWPADVPGTADLWAEKPSQAITAMVTEKLKALGAKNTKDEYYNPSRQTAEPKIHAELDKGGSVGSGSGLTAGGEIVNGPAMVTSTARTAEIFAGMRTSLENVNQQLADQTWALEQIARHTKALS